jgi:calcineurin-like phosphoesterase family protein
MKTQFFFTGDEHYGHENIIRLCHRPFKDVKEMNETLIARFNQVVPDHESSLTIHLGDIFYKLLPAEAVNILQSLHGRHVLILGNHDGLVEQTPYLKSLFWGVDKMHEMFDYSGNRIVLCHYPLESWNHSLSKRSWHLHGHIHSKNENRRPQRLDVGVDGHDFRPWTMEEIRTEIANVAQSGEHGFCKPEVGGSIPSVGSTMEDTHSDIWPCEHCAAKDPDYLKKTWRTYESTDN